jgi:ribosomal subunit interface protein
METPLELSFVNLDHSDAVGQRVRERVDKLERIFGRVTSCHVFVEVPHKQHRKGNRYEVRVEVRVPGGELAVNNKPGDVNAHEDLNVAIRDAFNAMERQLEKWKQKASGEVKVHDGQLQGRIAEIDHDKGFGQIAASDGRLVYFHRNSVVGGDFADLRQSDPVELVVQSRESEIGPQASTVRPISPARFTS